MSKELEALENIKHYDSRVGLHEDDYKIIETALKKLEKYENTKFIAMGSPELRNKEWLKDLFEKPSLIIADATPLEIKPIYSEQDQKKLKALEIIKEKEVNVSYLEYHFERGNGGYGEYVRTMDAPYLDYYPSSKILTKEEFNLLKEVLL